MTETIEGVVLKTSDYQENSKIVQLITKEHGLIGVYMKGATNYKSRGYHVAQPITHASFSIYYKKGLSTCYAGEVLTGFSSLKTDFEKNVYIYHLFEILLKTLEQHQPNGFLYTLLLTTITRINDTADKDRIALYTLAFELKTLYYLGVAPQLDVCVECGNDKGITTFDVHKGGFICRACLSYPTKPYTIATLKLLVTLFYINLDALEDLTTPNSDELLELRDIMDVYYEHHLGVRTNSRKYINMQK